MNKIEFKNEIKNFLNEVEQRRQEILNGNADKPNTIVGKKLLDFVRTKFNGEYQLTYSVCGLRLDSIFNMGSRKEGFIIASNFNNIKHLYWGLIYELIANKSSYEHISQNDFYYVYWGYLVRLIRNFNFTCTYINQERNEFGMLIKNENSYLDWMTKEETNIFSDQMIQTTYKYIIIENKNEVKDMNGNAKTVEVKGTSIYSNNGKRVSKEDLIDIISSFEEKPTIKQIVDKYFSKDSEVYISPDLLRQYIKTYDIESLIKTRNHSENFINKHNI